MFTTTFIKEFELYEKGIFGNEEIGFFLEKYKRNINSDILYKKIYVRIQKLIKE